MSHKHKKLLRDMQPKEAPQWVKDWIDDLIAKGLKPTIHNPYGDHHDPSTFVHEARIVAIARVHKV